MPTHLTIEEHVAALRRAGAALHEAAGAAGPHARVPTCAAWDVTKLVTHQGMVHRWAAGHLRGEKDPDTKASVAEAAAADDLLAWFDAGLVGLIEAVEAADDDLKAMVFLKDAPPPRRFWARRQAHETTIHAVDAVAARLGRCPTAADVDIDPLVAADGIDELLSGFITRGKGKLHADPPYTLLVRALDTGHAWTVRVGGASVETTPGEHGPGEVTFAGTAVQVYLSVWNRADELTVEGRQDVAEAWRKAVRIRWS
ncbi:maleylpyruvate isomerase N-terminal domain-containing protein [Virgisporangium aliadipatigenens]|uniref:maleylpyruvate isomerase N-terminal domain-containing protein n=1 Tax=Virgisporangium aliadipatigenens TaxID=741659 RepID=UPI001940F71B|nr:maleylpyruvate isomerase N-terminal domain-containing protein [Virgisporangium aliadipatigenens]